MAKALQTVWDLRTTRREFSGNALKDRVRCAAVSESKVGPALGYGLAIEAFSGDRQVTPDKHLRVLIGSLGEPFPPRRRGEQAGNVSKGTGSCSSQSVDRANPVARM